MFLNLMDNSLASALRFLKLLGLLAGVLVIAAGCNDDEEEVQPPATNNVVDVAAADANFEVLEAAIVRAGLADDLATGTFTVFAPTDAAFQTFFGVTSDAAAISAVNATAVNTLADLLSYHVLSGEELRTENLSIPARVTRDPLLAGNTRLFIWRSANAGTSFSVNGSLFVRSNLDADNGVIHEIDRVLVAPTNDVVQQIASAANLDILEAAINHAGLSTTLSNATGTFTVFAPNDPSFQAALGASSEADAITRINAFDVDTLADILTTHVLGTTRFTSDGLAGPGTPLTPGETLTIVNNAGSFTVAADGNFTPVAVVAPVDVLTTNGSIHYLNGLLDPFPANTVTNVANTDANFDVLQAALVRAGLDDDLRGDGPFTLFAPTDAAFQTFFATADEAATIAAVNATAVATLVDLLSYHVIAGEELETTDLAIPARVTRDPLLTGTTRLFIWRSGMAGTSFSVNGALFTRTDIEATNGVVQEINRVLSIPVNNVTQEVVSRGNLDILEAAVLRAGLDDDLASATGTFTLFAPSDAAFQTFLGAADEAAAITAVNALDPAELATILLTHVVGTVRFTSDALAGPVPSATLATGENVTIVNNAGAFTIAADGNTTPANVVAPLDILTTNGSIHYLDRVLDPTP